MTARIGRIPATCTAIRRARVAALDIAAEADADGRHGIARVLRRKAASAHPRDVVVVHGRRHVEASIAAHGVTATGRRTVGEPVPGDVERSTRAALAMVAREAVR